MNLFITKTGIKVKYSILILSALLIIGSSIAMVVPTYGQNYELAATVSVPNATEIVGYTGKIFVVDKVIDNGTYMVTNIPNSDPYPRIVGWLTLPNNDTVYYGINSENLNYKKGIYGDWNWVLGHIHFLGTKQKDYVT